MAKPKVYFEVDNQTNVKLRFEVKENFALNVAVGREGIGAREKKRLDLQLEVGHSELANGFLSWFMVPAGEHPYKLLARPDVRSSIPIDLSGLKDVTSIICSYTISNLDGAMADIKFDMRYTGEGFGRV